LVFCADKVKGGLWFRVVDLGVSGTGIQGSMWVLILAIVVSRGDMGT
jgi:hypothetical protein